MKTIKFVNGDNKQKQFATAVRKNVNAYFKEKGISTKANTALVIQSISMLSIYIVPFVLAMTIAMNAWLALLLMACAGIGMAGVGMCVMHDAVHGSYSNKRWVNKLMGSSMYLLGSNVLNWKIKHNILHHNYTNIDDYDEDIKSKGFMRMSEHAPLRKYHKYQHIHAFFFYSLMTISMLTEDFAQLMSYNKAGLTERHSNATLEFIKMIIVKSAYIFVMVVLPILITPFSWWAILIGFFTMHLVAGAILSIVFQLAHVVEGAEQPSPPENGIIETDWTVHELNTTADFARNNKLLTWYVGGLNFQIEHHLFPNICHIHYKDIAPIVQETAEEYGFNYNLKPSFRNALSSHVRRLKELGH